MNYNESYINDFVESNFTDYLRNPSKLSTLVEQNKRRRDYMSTYYGKFALAKESLDHYVTKKVSENRNYINTPEFKNYANYLVQLVKTDETEILTNNFLRQCKFESDLKPSISKEDYEFLTKKRDEVENKIYNIHAAIEKNAVLSQSDLDYVCDFHARLRDHHSEEYEEIIDYLVETFKEENNNLKLNQPELALIGDYLPSFYARIQEKPEMENTRIVICDLPVPNVEHVNKLCSTNKSEVFLNRTRILKALEGKRVPINEAMTIMNQGLATVELGNASRSEEVTPEAIIAATSRAISTSKDGVGSTVAFSDCRKKKALEVNEAFAKEHNKRELQALVEEGKKEQLSQEQAHELILNSDVKNLQDIIKNNPGILDNYHVLRIFYTDKGELNPPGFMFIKGLKNLPYGKDYLEEFFTLVPREMVNYFNTIKRADNYYLYFMENVKDYFTNKTSLIEMEIKEDPTNAVNIEDLKTKLIILINKMKNYTSAMLPQIENAAVRKQVTEISNDIIRSANARVIKPKDKEKVEEAAQQTQATPVEAAPVQQVQPAEKDDNTIGYYDFMFESVMKSYFDRMCIDKIFNFDFNIMRQYLKIVKRTDQELLNFVTNITNYLRDELDIALLHMKQDPNNKDLINRVHGRSTMTKYYIDTISARMQNEDLRKKVQEEFDSLAKDYTTKITAFRNGLGVSEAAPEPQVTPEAQTPVEQAPQVEQDTPVLRVVSAKKFFATRSEIEKMTLEEKVMYYKVCVQHIAGLEVVNQELLDKYVERLYNAQNELSESQARTI